MRDFKRIWKVVSQDGDTLRTREVYQHAQGGVRIFQVEERPTGGGTTTIGFTADEWRELQTKTRG